MDLLKSLLLFKCKHCRLERIIPPKYKSKALRNNWKHQFSCNKVKIPALKCHNDDFTFRSLEHYDQKILKKRLQDREQAATQRKLE